MNSAGGGGVSGRGQLRLGRNPIYGSEEGGIGGDGARELEEDGPEARAEGERPVQK